MNRTARSLFVVIPLMVSGCSKPSQVQPAATSSTPKVVQAAAPAVAEAPRSATDTASKSGLLTPHPSAGQHVDDRDYLISSDQDYTVGAQIVTGSGEMLFTRLSVQNQTASPAFFDLKDVTINAVGREVVVVPRTTLAMMVGGNSDTQAVVKKLLRDYWENRIVLAPGTEEEHFLLAVCGKGCPMPVTVHVAVGGQTYDFVFGDASKGSGITGEAPKADVTSSVSTQQTSGPSIDQIMDSLNIDDVTDRCGQPDNAVAPSLEPYLTYSNAFNTGPMVGKEFSTVDIFFRSTTKGTHIDYPQVDGIPYGSNHSRPISKNKLPDVLPCLLKGGIAK